MRKLFVTAIIALLAHNTFATCTPPTSNQFGISYTQDQSCYTGMGLVSSSSIYCFTEPSWDFGWGNPYRTVSFTIGPNDPVWNPNKFTVGAWIDFYSPSGSMSDSIQIEVDVTHPNNTTTNYTPVYWNGTYGSLSSCSGQQWGYFTANTGDTVTVTVLATNSGNASITVSVPGIGDTF